MKAIKRELDAVTRNLKTLTKKAESISEKLEKMTAESAGRGKATARKKTAGAQKTAKPVKGAPSRVKKTTAADEVYKIIKRSRKGVDTATLKAKTGFNDTKVRNVIFRLKKQGKIKAEKKGVYVSA